MLDHVSIGVADVARSKRFYDAVLGTLGFRCLSESPDGVGYGDSEPAFWAQSSARPVLPDASSGLHICFAARDSAAVEAFHAAGLRSGGTDNGKPGFRPEYSPDYYAAFLVDPDGYRIEAHCAKGG